MKFNNLRIRSKITIGFSVVFLLGVMTALVGITNSVRTQDDFSYLMQQPIEQYNLVMRFDASFIEARRITTTQS